jgi:hypothetical protein
MKYAVIEFPSSMFSWQRQPSGMTLVGEASCMGNRHLQALFNDACDVGFAVKSTHTGAVVTYVMSKPIYQGEGEDREICGWEYVPTAESIRKVPDCKGTRATIFND